MFSSIYMTEKKIHAQVAETRRALEPSSFPSSKKEELIRTHEANLWQRAEQADSRRRAEQADSRQGELAILQEIDIPSNSLQPRR